MTRATARLLVGRRIVAFDLRPFDGGPGRGTHYDPVLTLDNGAKLAFSATETDVGEYGIDPSYHPATKRRQ